MYYGSNASSSTTASYKVSKSKLLGKSGKNPYAAYSSSCDKCKTKIEQGKSLCNGCAYKNNGISSSISLDSAANSDLYSACSMCGKSINGNNTTNSKLPVIQNQKFSSK